MIYNMMCPRQPHVSLNFLLATLKIRKNNSKNIYFILLSISKVLSLKQALRGQELWRLFTFFDLYWVSEIHSVF